MDQIKLYNLELKTFTEQDALDYCFLNNINPDNITALNFYVNQLTDISGIKLFKNLKKLGLQNNKLTDINVLKYLTELEELYLTTNLKITDISCLSSLKKLKVLYLNNTKIKDISVIQNLTKLQYLDIGYLELESDQIKYIKNLNNLKKLFCHNGFKDMSVLNKLNNNIETIK